MAPELWQIAKPFGRPAKFQSPEELWNAFVKYTEWAANNPIVVQNARSQKQGTIKNEKAQYQQTVERPLTLFGFLLFANIRRAWSDFKEYYSKKSQEYCEVLRAIEFAIRDQQIQNALVGNYKENLVARLNNITDTIEQKVTGNINTRKELSLTDAKLFLEKIEKEI